MVIGLIGPNSYALFESVSSTIRDFTSKHGQGSVIKMNADEIEVPDLISACTEQSLFASKQLVVLRDVSQNSILKTKLSEIIETLPNSTTLLIYDSSLKKTDKLAKQIEKTGELIYRPLPSPYELKTWAKSQAKENGAQIESDAVDELIKRVGEDQWRIKEEIKKLSLYDQNINRKNVAKLVEITPQENIFHMLDCILKGDYKTALKKYELLREMKLEAQYVFSMLIWQAHNAALVAYADNKNTQEISEEAGVSSYIAQKIKQMLSKEPKNKIRQIINKLIEADILLKKTANNPDQVVKNVILRVCRI